MRRFEIKKLHELIELAGAGKEFEAELHGNGLKYTHTQFLTGVMWPHLMVVGEWHYYEKREPRIIWVHELKTTQGFKWGAVALSDDEGYPGRPVKFIEVMDE